MIEFYMRSCLKLLTKKNVENPFIITNIGSHPSCQIECKNICQDMYIYICNREDQTYLGCCHSHPDPLVSLCHSQNWLNNQSIDHWGVKSVVIHLNFGQQAFDWVDLGTLALGRFQPLYGGGFHRCPGFHWYPLHAFSYDGDGLGQNLLPRGE